METLKSNTITKEEILKLKQEDLLFITNPGRMGNVSSCTFIMKDDNGFKAFYISKLIGFIDDMFHVFPEWKMAWEKNDNVGNFNYIYMGFGNGLTVNKDIYDVFDVYLRRKVKSNEKYKKGEPNYEVIYNCWIPALIQMVNDNNIKIK